MFFILRKIFADRALFFKLLIASLFVNLLALATPIYVIQVLQRYIAYGVISTLITLFFGIIFIVIFGLKIHYSRLINKSPTNLIAWLHFFIFSFLLLISIRALRKWYFNDKHKNHKH